MNKWHQIQYLTTYLIRLPPFSGEWINEYRILGIWILCIFALFFSQLLNKHLLNDEQHRKIWRLNCQLQCVFVSHEEIEQQNASK